MPSQLAGQVGSPFVPQGTGLARGQSAKELNSWFPGPVGQRYALFAALFQPQRAIRALGDPQGERAGQCGESVDTAV